MVNAEQRLAAIVTGLGSVGVRCLVMGGHAARFYGVQRTTIDFDRHVAPDCWDDLAARLGQVAVLRKQSVMEGNSWRPHAFRRFQIGRLPDGREEWLEFWRENRLRTVVPLSPLHLALVEAVRRQYRAYRQAADRADKEAIRRGQHRPPSGPA